MSKCSPLNRSSEPEYKEAMEVIRKLVSEHKSNLVPGVPQLNMCDNAVMVSYSNVGVHLFLVAKLKFSGVGDFSLF